MAIKDIFKINRKTFFNPSAWIDVDMMQGQTRFLWATLKTFFTPEKATRQETFDEAVMRLNLSEKDIQSTISIYRYYAIFFVMCGLAIFFFSFYLLFKYHAFLDWLIGMAVTALFATQAFRYDFWAFQMKRRRLGLTFDDWKRNILGEKDNSR